MHHLDHGIRSPQCTPHTYPKTHAPRSGSWCKFFWGTGGIGMIDSPASISAFDATAYTARMYSQKFGVMYDSTTADTTCTLSMSGFPPCTSNSLLQILPELAVFCVSVLRMLPVLAVLRLLALLTRHASTPSTKYIISILQAYSEHEVCWEHQICEKVAEVVN